MIEKLVTIPVKAGYYGVKTGARAGKGLWNYTKNYLAPVLQDVDEIDYASTLEKRWKNTDIKKFLKKNPEKKATLDECVENAVDEHRTARKWAGFIDTVDKVTMPIGIAGDYAIFMGGKYTLALVEEAVEMLALKGPFMAYYAKKHGAKRIPGWLTMEFLSHGLPFADLYIDCRNNFVKGVDKDIESYAANLFREKEGLEKPLGMLSRVWNKIKGVKTSTPASEPIPAPALSAVQEYAPENRIKEYLNSVGQDKYESFMKAKREELPQELERFITWGFETSPKKPKWYHSSTQFKKNSDKINEIVCRHLNSKAMDHNTSVVSAYELEIAGERKYVIEVMHTGMEDYRKVKNIPNDMHCIQPMLGVVYNYKLIADAETGRIEDSDLYKHELWGGLLDDFPEARKEKTPEQKLLETKIPELVASPQMPAAYDKQEAVNAA